MAWTKNGTVAVSNGQTRVDGTGTAFVTNKAQPGDAILLADGKFYEVASVQSDTQLTLGTVYAGGTASGMAYAILPTNNRLGELAGLTAELLNTFVAVRDGIGQGLFPNGTVTVPGIRAAADQDTGFRWLSGNALALVTGGADRIFADAAGNIGIGTSAPVSKLHVSNAGAEGIEFFPALAGGVNLTQHYNRSNNAYVRNQIRAYAHEFYIGGNQAMQLDAAGNLLVGVASGSNHIVSKSVAEGATILQIYSAATGSRTLDIRGVAAEGFSGAATAMYVGKNTGTGRSINTAGTINASGADYAEYVRKSATCGAIAKGDVCGVDRNSELTRTWAEATRFVVKSTDPNLVGGDTWASHLSPRPEAPGDAPIEPVAPKVIAWPTKFDRPVRFEDEDDDAFVARMAEHLHAIDQIADRRAQHDAAVTAYHDAAARYPKLKADHAAAVAAYETALAAWTAELEAARQTVDRIAFCGQVPVNVDEATLGAIEAALADGTAVYLVAAARGAGIGVQAVREADMTLPLYMRRLGAVWTIRDGRPWMDVQHG